MDAALSAGPIGLLRRAYARSVRPRELAGLVKADRVLTAGWSDLADLKRATNTPAAWAPTGLDVLATARTPGSHLRVGLLGNFAHSATTDAASQLIASPLGADPEVEIVLAGLGSEEWAAARGVQALGRVDSIYTFYAQVDATVVLVSNGSGMKTKLAEAALAGCPVITTQAGAAGYPPELSRHFVVVDGAERLDPVVIRRALEERASSEARAAFEGVLGLEPASARYAAALANA